MRENRLSGSEGGGAETNRFFLPLSLRARYGRKKLAGDLERVLGPEGERPSGKGLVSHPVF